MGQIAPPPGRDRANKFCSQPPFSIFAQNYWLLSDIFGHRQILLDTVRHFQILSDTVRQYQPLLDTIGNF